MGLLLLLIDESFFSIKLTVSTLLLSTEEFSRLLFSLLIFFFSFWLFSEDFRLDCSIFLSNLLISLFSFFSFSLFSVDFMLIFPLLFPLVLLLILLLLFIFISSLIDVFSPLCIFSFELLSSILLSFLHLTLFWWNAYDWKDSQK